MAKFAVAIYRGIINPGPNDRPEEFMTWDEFKSRTFGFEPSDLLEIEMRLRIGRIWQEKQAGFTLVPVMGNSAVVMWIREMMQAIEERKDASIH